MVYPFVDKLHKSHICHLQMIFFLICKTTKNEVEALHHILYVYEKVSRQAINLNKFEIFFSSNTLVAKRNILSSKLGAIIVGN